MPHRRRAQLRSPTAPEPARSRNSRTQRRSSAGKGPPVRGGGFPPGGIAKLRRKRGEPAEAPPRLAAHMRAAEPRSEMVEVAEEPARPHAEAGSTKGIGSPRWSATASAGTRAGVARELHRTQSRGLISISTARPRASAEPTMRGRSSGAREESLRVARSAGPVGRPESTDAPRSGDSPAAGGGRSGRGARRRGRAGRRPRRAARTPAGAPRQEARRAQRVRPLAGRVLRPLPSASRPPEAPAPAPFSTPVEEGLGQRVGRCVEGSRSRVRGNGDAERRASTNKAACDGGS